MGMMQIWMSMLTWNAVILERYASTSSLHKATRSMRLVLNPQCWWRQRACAVLCSCCSKILTIKRMSLVL